MSPDEYCQQKQPRAVLVSTIAFCSCRKKNARPSPRSTPFAAKLTMWLMTAAMSHVARTKLIGGVKKYRQCYKHPQPSGHNGTVTAYEHLSTRREPFDRHHRWHGDGSQSETYLDYVVGKILLACCRCRRYSVSQHLCIKNPQNEAVR